MRLCCPFRFFAWCRFLPSAEAADGGHVAGQADGGGHDDPAGADGPDQRARRRAQENERHDDVRGQQGGAGHGGEEGLAAGQGDVEVDGGVQGELVSAPDGPGS